MKVVKNQLPFSNEVRLNSLGYLYELRSIDDSVDEIVSFADIITLCLCDRTWIGVMNRLGRFVFILRDLKFDDIVHSLSSIDRSIVNIYLETPCDEKK